jgi:glycosyltransferase involved in cell wall biosynthesis
MKNNDLLFIHNILWSHYTGVVISELNTLVQQHGGELQVIHIAETQQNRKGIGNIDARYHRYKHEILFKGDLEAVGVFQQLWKGIPKICKSKASYILVSGYNLPLYIAAIFLAPLLRKKLIVVGDATEADKKRSFWKEKLKGIGLKMADKLLCYGQSHKSYLMKLGVPSNKIFIRVQSTDNEEIREIVKSTRIANTPRLTSANKFIFVGRLIPEKNLFTLLQAFGSLNTSWHLLIVGDGILRSDLVAYCQQQGIQNVEFYGGAPLADVIALIIESDVLVLPSVSETWGLVVNEAMLCEKAVIVSTNCGCASELVENGKNGFTFHPDNVKELADCMRAFTEEKANALIMGKEGYEKVKLFTPEKSASQIFAAIYNL